MFTENENPFSLILFTLGLVPYNRRFLFRFFFSIGPSSFFGTIFPLRKPILRTVSFFVPPRSPPLQTCWQLRTERKSNSSFCRNRACFCACDPFACRRKRRPFLDAPSQKLIFLDNENFLFPSRNEPSDGDLFCTLFPHKFWCRETDPRVWDPQIFLFPPYDSQDIVSLSGGFFCESSPLLFEGNRTLFSARENKPRRFRGSLPSLLPDRNSPPLFRRSAGLLSTNAK